jgi:response regulator RpfG family c-di-GMP phosphodiesterase
MNTELLSQEEKANITQKKVILVVDDAVEYLRVITRMLEFRYNLSLAKSGEDALRVLSQGYADLILLDIEMPGMSGLELYNSIGMHPIYRTVPVIFVTAHAQSDIIAKAIELGAKGYIVKPFQERALLAKISQVLSSSPGKMAAVELSKRLVDIENHLFKLEKLLKENADDSINAFMITDDLLNEILEAFNVMLEEDKYSRSVNAHLNRIHSLIKNKDTLALPRLREFIDALGVRELL